MSRHKHLKIFTHGSIVHTGVKRYIKLVILPQSVKHEPTSVCGNNYSDTYTHVQRKDGHVMSTEVGYEDALKTPTNAWR